MFVDREGKATSGDEASASDAALQDGLSFLFGCVAASRMHDAALTAAIFQFLFACTCKWPLLEGLDATLLVWLQNWWVRRERAGATDWENCLLGLLGFEP